MARGLGVELIEPEYVPVNEPTCITKAIGIDSAQISAAHRPCQRDGIRSGSNVGLKGHRHVVTADRAIELVGVLNSFSSRSAVVRTSLMCFSKCSASLGLAFFTNAARFCSDLYSHV
jgi:hypothetical protein